MAKPCLYTKKVMQYFKHPKHAGSIKNPDAVATVGNAVCGDVLKFYLKIKNDKIIDIKYKTYGCASAIASSEAISIITKNKKLDDALKITHQDVVNHLGTLPKIKIHCSVLGIEALKKAIEIYRKK